MIFPGPTLNHFLISAGITVWKPFEILVSATLISLVDVSFYKLFISSG
jgi:hypothetical protein